jgi:hypothetical protein
MTADSPDRREGDAEAPSRTEPEAGRGGRAVLGGCGLALCLLAFPALLLGQSLGDAARKERERRDKGGKTRPASHALTEDDLATTRGRLANEPGTPQPGAAEETQESPAAAPTPTPRVVHEPSALPGQEAYWRERARRARERLALADLRYKTLQRMIRFGQPLMYDANGRRVIYSNPAMKARADEVEAELRAAEKALEDLADEARHAGALAGWLRE